jgi:uncharacterized membrane protein (UPF0127 family)
MPSSATAKTVWARSRFTHIVVYGGFLLSLIVVGLVAYGFGRSGDYRTLTAAGHTYTLKIASTDAAREKGLGGLPGISRNSGMLFTYPAQSTLCFWMKDTHFPLDMIWLNTQQQVTHIEPGVQPARYPRQFCARGQYVVELNAGQALAAGIKPGQTLNF